MIGHRMQMAIKMGKRHALRSYGYVVKSRNDGTAFALAEAEWYKRFERICRKTKKGCSCWMCSHQREVFGPRMQEIRERLKMEIVE